MTDKTPLQLSDLNQRIKQVIEENLPELIWVVAEISEISVNHRSGHCYLELVEKESTNDQIRARARATIWGSTYRTLKAFFETTTGQLLGEGIKVMVKVSVDYHEIYQLSLNIRDIDPTYTLGDLALKRREIIRKLEEAGVFDMNQMLEIPLVPQRIAVISSPTAAGYGDFIDQLTNNDQGYLFHYELFPSLMQGKQTANSIIQSLDLIGQRLEQFDVVVIIRGGGSKIDLTGFDDFELGYMLTQFPIPVITGIGHERDDTILDLVAHTRCKTPTAVAEFLISLMEEFEYLIDDYISRLVDHTREKLQAESLKMMELTRNLPKQIQIHISRQENLLNQKISRSRQYVQLFMKSLSHHLEIREEQVKLLDPVRILEKGYSLTYHNGQLVKEVNHLKPGDILLTRLHEGQVDSTVTKRTIKKS